jgi:hypothetical protein
VDAGGGQGDYLLAGWGGGVGAFGLQSHPQAAFLHKNIDLCGWKRRFSPRKNDSAPETRFTARATQFHGAWVQFQALKRSFGR